jgi:hypothetical protein
MLVNIVVFVDEMVHCVYLLRLIQKPVASRDRPRAVSAPGPPEPSSGGVDSGAAGAVDDDRDHPERVPERQSNGRPPRRVVFPGALEIPKLFRVVGVVEDVPAGDLVKDVVHGVFLLTLI